jgi:hypothetical protein
MTKKNRGFHFFGEFTNADDERRVIGTLLATIGAKEIQR